MRRSLTTQSVPYLFSLLTAMVLYFVNQVTDHYLRTPIVYYSWKTKEIAVEERGTRGVLELELINLSDAHHLDQLLIDFKYRTRNWLEPGRITYKQAVNFSPAPLIHSDSFTLSRDSLTASLVLTNFQPKNKYHFIIHTLTATEDDSYPMLYVRCNDTVYMTESGSIKFLLLNRLSINLAMLGLLLMTLVVYWMVIIKKRSRCEDFLQHAY
jgi:hypothetical protein